MTDEDYIRHLKKTGYCWKCGGIILEPVFLTKDFDGYLFCDKKHQEQFIRNQDRQILKGKKEGYGLVGSTH